MPTVTDMESYQQYAEQQQQANNEFNAAQAAKQMEFQKMMSDTAHVREVADLKAAGLNPVLSAGGQGASSAQGAAAEADTSAAANVGAILQQVLQAQSAREVANMYTQASVLAAQISASASMYGADMSYANAEDHPKSVREVAARQLNSNMNTIKAVVKNAADAITLGKKVASSGTKSQNMSFNKLFSGMTKWQKFRYQSWLALHGRKHSQQTFMYWWKNKK